MYLLSVFIVTCMQFRGTESVWLYSQFRNPLHNLVATSAFFVIYADINYVKRLAKKTQTFWLTW
jgi:hypothetical protein